MIEQKRSSIFFHGPRVTEVTKLEILYQLEDWEQVLGRNNVKFTALFLFHFFFLQPICIIQTSINIQHPAASKNETGSTTNPPPVLPSTTLQRLTNVNGVFIVSTIDSFVVIAIVFIDVIDVR